MTFTLVIGNKNYSSWSLRAWLVMKQFGLDFKEVRVLLFTSETKEHLSQYSPSGKVPVLLHNTLKVWDSLAICEYLAEQFPQFHWWPKNETARAVARSISAEMHSGFQNLRQQMPMNCRGRYPGIGMTPKVQEDIARITAIWRDCRQNNNSGSMLFGGFTIADAMFAPVVLRFITYGVNLDEVSRAYSEAILALPAVQEWLKAAEAESESIPQAEFQQ